MYVDDHIDAIDMIFHKGKIGETYNIGGESEIRNIDLIKNIIFKIDKKLNRENGFSKSLISYVNDRLGHDYRYSVDISKIKKELGWKPKTSIDKGIEKTIDWYIKDINLD